MYAPAPGTNTPNAVTIASAQSQRSTRSCQPRRHPERAPQSTGQTISLRARVLGAMGQDRQPTSTAGFWIFATLQTLGSSKTSFRSTAVLAAVGTAHLLSAPHP